MNWNPLRRAVRAGVLYSILCLAGIGAARAEVRLAEARHLFDLTAGAGVALAMPSDVAIGSGGRVYVVDGGNHRVVVFSPSGQFLNAFGRKGEGQGEFRDPVGIGADGRGRIYVADSGNYRIQIFDANGGFISAFPAGKGRPIDVAPDAEGKALYVTGSHRVTVFSSGGQVLRQWGGEGPSEGEFRYPASLVVSPEGRLYVVDVLNTRVQVFDAMGQPVFQVGEWGVLPGQFFRPKGVALDSQGRVYVSDSYMDLVEVFNSSYQFQHVLGANGKIRKFTAPGGIAIDAADRLYVAEMLANKVSVFSLR